MASFDEAGSPMPVVESFVARSFLTRIPVRAADPARGAALFPWSAPGSRAVVGGAAYGLAQSYGARCRGYRPRDRRAANGRLHLDGLADTADARCQHTRPRARDHARPRTGAGRPPALDLLVKARRRGPAGDRAVVLYAIAAGALSRAVPVLLGLALPSVREDGAGAAFRVALASALIAASIGIAVAFATGVLHGAVLVAVAAGVAVVLSGWYRRWLGGVTGDTLGAAAELTETAVLVAAAAFV